MLDFNFAASPDQPLTVLCLGAHSDDLEIGCGGTILKLLHRHHQVRVHWTVFCSSGPRKQEAEAGAARFLAGAKEARVSVLEFRDGFLPYLGGEVKDHFEQLKAQVDPDLIFTHYRHDLHQDHRLVCELTWNTFRDHLILEYEIPKYDGDLGQPNLFVRLDRELAGRKIQHLMDTFASQRGKGWFDAATFEALLRLRGVESQAPEGLAEAFYCRKIAF